MGKRREFGEKGKKGKKGTQLCGDVGDIIGNIAEIGKIIFYYVGKKQIEKKSCREKRGLENR